MKDLGATCLGVEAGRAYFLILMNLSGLRKEWHHYRRADSGVDRRIIYKILQRPEKF